MRNNWWVPSSMSKAALGIIGLVALGIGGLVVALQVQKRQEAANPTLARITGPASDAVFIDSLFTPVGAATEPATVGFWVPKEGWQGTATKITKESDGIAIRMWYHAAGMPSTGAWVIAYLEGYESLSELPFAEGAQVRYGGKINLVEVGSDGVVPTPRMIVRPAYLLK